MERHLSPEAMSVQVTQKRFRTIKAAMYFKSHYSESCLFEWNQLKLLFNKVKKAYPQANKLIKHCSLPLQHYWGSVSQNQHSQWSEMSGEIYSPTTPGGPDISPFLIYIFEWIPPYYWYITHHKHQNWGRILGLWWESLLWPWSGLVHSLFTFFKWAHSLLSHN